MRLYHLTLISPRGDTEQLDPEGSPLAALWRIRKTLREEPPGSVGIVSTVEPDRVLHRVRVCPDGALDTVEDAIVGSLPAGAQVAALVAVDAFDGDEPDERLFATVLTVAVYHRIKPSAMGDGPPRDYVMGSRP